MEGTNLNNKAAWETYYDCEEKQISAQRIESVRQIHRVFLEVLLAQPKSMATEIGIGTGTMGYTLRCLAQERGMTLRVNELDYSLQFLTTAMSFNGNAGITYIGADTFALPFSHVHRRMHMIFHQGLLEHFQDEEVRRMLKEQLRVADTVIATVPSHEYIFQAGLRGDERLMTLEQWSDIISPVAEVSGFYYGLNPDERYHICLVVKG